MSSPTAGPTRVPAVRLLAILAAVSVACTTVPAVATTPMEPAGVGGAPDPAGGWPLAPPHPVVRSFDPPTCTWCAGHRGVDLAGSPGQVARAALAGTVTYAGVLAGRGVVVVDHGATRTTYEPVAATTRVGDVVAAGDPIGRLEVVGSHCFPSACLHWGWIRNADDVYLDPLGLVGGDRPVRLLPLWRDTPTAGGPLGGYPRWRPELDSSPRVRLLIGRAQPVGADVRVELGGGQ